MSIKGELERKLKEALPNEAARRFVFGYAQFCHSIDDLIDEAFTPELLLRTFAECISVLSSTYYSANAAVLFPLVISITNAYADSVAWEKETDQWKLRVSDVLRTAGNEMILAVVNLESGWDKMREISLLLREYSYKEHHDEVGNNV